MGLFDVFSISGSGTNLNRIWLDCVSDNIANINTVSPTSGDAFRERFVDAQAVQYGSGEGGVRVAGVSFGSGEGKLVYQPDHPLADANGYVKMPDIDLGDQMTQLLIAQRGYQANLAVVDRATSTYQAALQLGKG